MENLLASIRQAIDSDLGGAASTVRSSSAASIKGAMEELRVKFEPQKSSRITEVSNEISELRNKINRNRGIPQEPKTPFAQIMAGQVRLPARPALPAPAAHLAEMAPAPVASNAGYASSDYADPGYTHEQEEQWAEDPYAAGAGSEGYGQAEPQLLSHESAHAAQSSFNELAQALMARAMGERSVEDMTQELLKAMLRNWLDANLPSLVERLVREEIERVARRGR